MHRHAFFCSSSLWLYTNFIGNFTINKHIVVYSKIQRYLGLAQMPITTHSIISHTLSFKNGYKILKLYYISQGIFLPVKKAPKL